MKKIVIEIDGKEQEYNSLTDCAKALGVPVATIYSCASYGYRCKGYAVRYADGMRRTRIRKKATIKKQVEAKPKATAEDVTKLIAEWYTKKWKEYISSDALVSLIEYIKEHWN